MNRSGAHRFRPEMPGEKLYIYYKNRLFRFKARGGFFDDGIDNLADRKPLHIKSITPAETLA
jgi:hypothetical protein